MRFRIAACCAGLGLLLAASVNADSIYLENFDAGTALNADSLVNYGSIDSYWTDSDDQNGNVVPNTSSIGSFGDAIAQDASGSGYFLFEGTDGDDSSTNFFVSSAIAVTPNTEYTVGFDLINATSCDNEFYDFGNCSAQVLPEINGTAIGSAVSADDVVADQTGTPPNWPWQAFTFSFNSGSNTTVTLTLQDVFTGTDGYGSGTGNDFGIDNISVSTELAAAPEPSTFALIAAAGALLAFRRRRASRA